MPKTKTKKPKRDRTGYVMVHLDDPTKARLQAIGTHWEAETGLKVNKSDALRIAIKRTYDDLPDCFQIPNPES